MTAQEKAIAELRAGRPLQAEAIVAEAVREAERAHGAGNQPRHGLRPAQEARDTKASSRLDAVVIESKVGDVADELGPIDVALRKNGHASGPGGSTP
jgi:hypothetical protein